MGHCHRDNGLRDYGFSILYTPVVLTEHQRSLGTVVPQHRALGTPLAAREKGHEAHVLQGGVDRGAGSQGMGQRQRWAPGGRQQQSGAREEAAGAGLSGWRAKWGGVGVTGQHLTATDTVMGR